MTAIEEIRVSLARLLERSEHLDDCIDGLKESQARIKMSLDQKHQENSARLRALEDTKLQVRTQVRATMLWGTVVWALLQLILHLAFKGA